MENMLENVRTYFHGKMNFVAGICEKLKVSEIIENSLSKSNGRKPDIPYGTLAEMMIVNLCDSHKPLYLIQEYYEQKDLEGIFNTQIDIEQLNDDRFGNYLDQLYAAGPRKIFSEVSAQAFATYGLTIKNINYDTTSKVMWGEYESTEGKVGAISITFGHSKQKREDKKQIKMGVGVANGIIVDAKVLSGNVDDKTYNNENLDDVDAVLERTHTDKKDFYYIADSSFFTEANILKAESKNIKFITRIPETTTLSKALIRKALKERANAISVVFENAQKKPVKYLISEYNGEYKGNMCKFAVSYSYGLEDIKNKTILRHSKKEEEELKKYIKKYVKHNFACEADAKKEIDEIEKLKVKKLKYHALSCYIEAEAVKKVGRPSQKEYEKQYEYVLKFDINKDNEKIKDSIEEACTFVLASNDLNISGEELLREYKTQSSVEKKFQQLKSPDFINSLYVKTPERVEALSYMLLMTMMILSVVEHVVRRKLKEENEIVIGPGKIKMVKPTLKSIVSIFHNVAVFVIKEKNMKRRILMNPLNDSQSKIIRYLGLDETIFMGSVL